MRIFQAFMCMVLAVSIFVARAESSKTEDRLSLGKKEWPPVDSGMLFLDGKYITPPYCISRDNGNIYINKIFIEKLVNWPPPKQTKIFVSKEDPVMPASITIKTQPYDKDYVEYISLKIYYIRNNFKGAEVVAQVIQAYNQLPCVSVAREVSWNTNAIDVIWADGKNFHAQIYPQPAPLPYTYDEALARINGKCEYFYSGLSHGTFFYWGSPHIRSTSEKDARFLIKALRESSSEDEFFATLPTNAIFKVFSEKTVKNLYKSKALVDDLEQGLEQSLRKRSQYYRERSKQNRQMRMKRDDTATTNNPPEG